MSPGADSASEELKLMLEKLEKYQKATGSLSPYYQDLLAWYKNVDKRYAWVVLMALWFMMVGTLGPYRIYGLVFAKVTAEGVYTREEASWPVSMIFTIENCFGPIVSILIYYISHRKALFIGSILLTAGNGFTALSNSLILDITLIGIVQGIGYSFIFMPFLEIINSYFLRYRNLAFGFALTGGTASMFIFTPVFRWVMDTYPWRYSYVAIAMVCCINLLMVPLLKPNPQPRLQRLNSSRRNPPSRKISQISTMSRRVLRYQSSVRSQSNILISRQPSKVGRGLQRQESIISVNPFASTVGLERKISRTIAEELQPQLKSADSQMRERLPPIEPNLRRISTVSRCIESMSLNEMDQDMQEEDFNIGMILDVLKTPGFHLIWYNELLYFWIFSIYTLILVDYGVDHGCTIDQAESLMAYQSAGELLGRICLTYLVDLNLVSNKVVIVFVLFSTAALLMIISQVSGYLALASLTLTISAVVPLIYILVNVFLVDYLGEQRVTLGYGMASCIGGIMMSFRPQAVGYFRDYLQSYEYLLFCLAGSSVFGGILWILEPLISRLFGKRPTQVNASNNRTSFSIRTLERVDEPSPEDVESEDSEVKKSATVRDSPA